MVTITWHIIKDKLIQIFNLNNHRIMLISILINKIIYSKCNNSKCKLMICRIKIKWSNHKITTDKTRTSKISPRKKLNLMKVSHKFQN